MVPYKALFFIVNFQSHDNILHLTHVAVVKNWVMYIPYTDRKVIILQPSGHACTHSVVDDVDISTAVYLTT